MKTHDLQMLALRPADVLFSEAVRTLRAGIGRDGFSQLECLFILRAYHMLKPWQQLYLKNLINSRGKL